MFHRCLLAVALGFSLACSLSATAAVGQRDESAISTEIDRVLAATFPADAPGAAALIVQNGRVLLRKGYGQANLELGIPVDPTHVFRIGSMTKQFTAVAILQLVEAGKIKLDDDIATYVPDYPLGGQRVTLAQLLTHTAGIPSIEAQPAWLESWRQDMSLAQLLAFTKNKPLDFAPGADWKYSNTGYILLGAVIEKASGQSYAAYLQAHIFTPAGMTSSCCGSEQRLIPRRIPGYSRDNAGWVNAPYFSMTQPFAAGAILSSVDDLEKWEQALAAGKLVSSALLKQAYTPVQLPDGRSSGYGFGWQLGTLGKHATVEHGGGIQGFSSYALRIADAQLYVAILCNTDHPPAPLKTVAHSLARLALGEQESTPAPTSVPEQTLADYVGSYRVSPTVSLEIIEENGKLVGQLGPGKRPLTATAHDEFATPGNEMRLTFQRNAADHVDRVMVRGIGPGPGQIWQRITPPQQ